MNDTNPSASRPFNDSDVMSIPPQHHERTHTRALSSANPTVEQLLPFFASQYTKYPPWVWWNRNLHFQRYPVKDWFFTDTLAHQDLMFGLPFLLGPNLGSLFAKPCRTVNLLFFLALSLSFILFPVSLFDTQSIPPWQESGNGDRWKPTSFYCHIRKQTLLGWVGRVRKEGTLDPFGLPGRFSLALRPSL
jgi:hypothetical protein